MEIRTRTSRRKAAFTLVELIVVITILAILGTIGFISLKGYSTSARDASRTSDLATLSKGLDLMLARGATLPLPDANSINLSASGVAIGFQGYAGPNVFRTTGFGTDGQDPLDNKFYTYLVNAGQSRYQLLTLLESGDSPSLALDVPGVGTAYAWYESRYPLSRGTGMGILLWTGATANQPVQELYNAGSFTGIDLATTAATYTAYFSGRATVTGTGSVLGLYFSTRQCDVPVVSDTEGNLYNTVKIGSQCWMKSNLRTLKNPMERRYRSDPRAMAEEAGRATSASTAALRTRRTTRRTAHPRPRCLTVSCTSGRR